MSSKAMQASSKLYSFVTTLSTSNSFALIISITSSKSDLIAFLEPWIISSFFCIMVKLKSRLFFDMPTRMTLPPNAAASIQFWKVEGIPTASTVTSKPLPFVISDTCLSKSTLEVFRIVPFAPRDFARSSLSWEMSAI